MKISILSSSFVLLDWFRLVLVLVGILSLKWVAIQGEETNGPSNVVVLTSENFDQLTSKGNWFIEL
jgi:hypothetical protein